MFVSLINTLAVLAFFLSVVFAADPALGTYNIDDDITVSGLSSGGFMAVQVSYSEAHLHAIITLNCAYTVSWLIRFTLPTLPPLIKGAAVFAGVI
jgi:hypothetical protein